MRQKPRRKATKIDPDWKVAGYRSSLEMRIGKDLEERGIECFYEYITVEYEVVETRKYTPDFFVVGSNLYIEAKGWLTLEDRKKAIRVRDSNSDIEVRFVFQNSTNKIRKGSKTTYGDWCDKNGFKYADKIVPQEWIDEKG